VYQEVARIRMEDANTLLANNRHNGAVYLAGYAIECQLKYACCRRRGETYLQAQLEVHDWDTLVNAAGVLSDIRRQSAIHSIYSALVDKWGPSLRYQTARYRPSEANRLYNEMQQLYDFLRELAP
jgi:hypothetical protein